MTSGQWSTWHSLTMTPCPRDRKHLLVPDVHVPALRSLYKLAPDSTSASLHAGRFAWAQIPLRRLCDKPLSRGLSWFESATFTYTPFTRESIHEAHMKQTYSMYTCTTCALGLLHVCFMFDSWMLPHTCKRGIKLSSGFCCELSPCLVSDTNWFVTDFVATISTRRNSLNARNFPETFPFHGLVRDFRGPRLRLSSESRRDGLWALPTLAPHVLHTLLSN